MTRQPGTSPAVFDAPVYVLRNCEVRVSSREIVGDDGPLPIEPRAFDVLVYLIEQRDRVVSKKELLRQVWRRVAVSDSVVARAVMKARLAISDVQSDAPLIRTMHRVGYRFVGSVRPADTAESRAFAPAAAHGLVYVALLPFENGTGQAEKVWLEMGVMSKVAAALTAHSGLRVAPVSSVLTALEGTGAGDSAQHAQVLHSSLGVTLAVHLVVSGTGDGHELRATLLDDRDSRGFPALTVPATR